MAPVVNRSWLCWCTAHPVPDSLASLVLSHFRAPQRNGNRIFLAASVGQTDCNYFLDLNIQHFSLHKYSRSCMRALLYSVLFSVFRLYTWRRVWIASMQSLCISRSPVPWKNRSYGWVARRSRRAMSLQACLAVTYLLQLVRFLFMVAKPELSIAKPEMCLSLMAGYS